MGMSRQCEMERYYDEVVLLSNLLILLIGQGILYFLVAMISHHYYSCASIYPRQYENIYINLPLTKCLRK